MIEKIIRMVSQFGETNIESLMSWFPQEEKSIITEQIKSSNDLLLIGDVVSIKKHVNIEEMELTQEMIIRLLEKYNNKVKEEFNRLTSNPEQIKLDTVISFLQNKYILEEYENGDGLCEFVQLEKDTLLNKGYAVIVPELTTEAYEKIDSSFDTETVFIYYINSNQCGECSTTKDFYIKSCEAILNEYMVIYKLKTDMIELKFIENIVGGATNE